MSVQEKINDLNRRIEKIDSSGKEFRSTIKNRVDGIKNSLTSLGERIKTIDAGSGDAREEINKLLATTEELRNENLKVKEELTKITSEKEELTSNNSQLKQEIEKILKDNNVEEIGNKITESTKSLDAIIASMEGDSSVNDALSALEKQIEGLEEILKEKEDNEEEQSGGRKKRRSRKKTKRRKNKRKTRKH
tara:strand:- start:207 stop:782 length:576 start_codon:yes stop_codon:yes gene_type:complete